MSTNFYLYRPSDSCEACGHERNEPTRLHIGKSSGGWVFLWRGWDGTEGDGPGVPLETPDAWFAYLADEMRKGAEIKDQYRMDFSLKGFREHVYGKRAEPRRNSRIKEASAVAVDGDDIVFREFS